MLFDTAAALAQARKIQGVPWVHQGRNPALGLDCIGVLLSIYRAGGWTPINPDLANIRGYRRKPITTIMQEILEKEADPIQLSEIRWFDFILLNVKGYDIPHHVAIVTRREYNNWYVMHHRDMVVREHRLDNAMKVQAFAYYRVKGLELPSDLLGSI